MTYPNILSAADQAYSQLRRKIFQKEYEAGERLSEAELAQQIGVSRTPIREALRRLATEGLVVIVPNQGVWVASPTLEGMLQTYEVREMLECMAIEKTAPNATPLLIAQLEEKITEEENIIQTRNLDRYLEVNSDFHTLIALGSGNQVLVDLLKSVLSSTAVYMVFFEPFFNFDSLNEHRIIVDALKQKNPVESSVAMRQHIKVRIDNVLQKGIRR